MSISDKILAALIAAIVSIVVAIISYYQNKRRLETQGKILDRQLQHNFTDRLYDLRLEHYAKAFEITEHIRSKSAPHYINPPEQIRSILDQLNKWKGGQASLVMSSDTINQFRALKSALYKNPGHGNEYTKQQAQKILQSRARFRGAMRGDLGLLYESDDE